MTKQGTDCKALEEYFGQLKDDFDDMDVGLRESPLKTLRDLIPDLTDVNDKGKPFPLDEQLVYKGGNECAWEKYYQQGKEKIIRFNQKFADAIKMKDAEGLLGLVLFGCLLIVSFLTPGALFMRPVQRYAYRSRERENNAVEKFKKCYIERYFGSMYPFFSALLLATYAVELSSD